MCRDGLPILTPRFFRFSDVDEFRSAVRNLDVEFTPFVRKISAAQVILSLPGCDINFTQSFPRIVEGQLGPNCTAVAFSMDDGAPIRFNGVERDRSVITIGGGGSVYTTVERTAHQYTSIVFTKDMQDRGWPETGPNWKVFETDATAEHRLRELVRQILFNSGNIAASDANGISLAIRESLLAAIDAAFAAIVDAKWASRANSIRQFRIFRDIQAVLSGSIGRPVYSEELARQVGVSVRTMHDTVQRFRGMSLHRYLRLRRLWLVRQQLLAGAGTVKACALACGFWHMGDFARTYRSQFGEAPSETLTRSPRSMLREDAREA
ncbi:AraC family transcriptional regulator [Bradyrhizobium japonicum]|nr:helix-turn-helix domain-containing protein [Bradyrhizobium japonicum]MBR0958989.1 AraC family transcriptional regulator [Bradyrhizobium japonicum]